MCLNIDVPPDCPFAYRCRATRPPPVRSPISLPIPDRLEPVDPWSRCAHCHLRGTHAFACPGRGLSGGDRGTHAGPGGAPALRGSRPPPPRGRRTGRGGGDVAPGPPAHTHHESKAGLCTHLEDV